jgi:hypothetical protein
MYDLDLGVRSIMARCTLHVTPTKAVQIILNMA